MAHFLRHRLSDAALESTLQLLDCHMPKPVYKSKYRFLKDFKNPNSVKYYYCYDCQEILNFDTTEEATVCTSCDTEYLKSSLNFKGQFFMYIPLKNQLVDLIQSKVFCNFNKRDKQVNDILNSKVYKYLQRHDIIGENDITVSWNVNGIALFKSSKKSTWSILVKVINFPYRIARGNILLCGLWHSKKKPLMKIFLKAFAEELHDLANTGVECSSYTSEEVVNRKVHAIVCPVDTIARPTVQNMVQFNGKYGCPYCLQKGEVLENEPGTARVYCVGDYPERTEEQHAKHIRLAMRKNKKIKGVKGPSIMSVVPNLNTLVSYPAEYMHAWLLGVAKMLIKAWIDSSNHDKPWYIGNQINEVNERLQQIQPPCEITRITNYIEELSKAAEIKNFTIYYSAAVLVGILPQTYYKHWVLFVVSTYILLQEEQSQEEFEFAQRSLLQFQEEIQNLYGKKYMTFNVHTLKHNKKFLKHFGSLWAWSAFPFEHYNSVIKDLYHGTQCIPEQICKSYHRLRLIKNQSHVFEREECSEDAVNLYVRLMNECRVKNCINYGDHLRLFHCKEYQLSEVEQNLLEIYFDDVFSNINRCDRFVFKKIMFHSQNYTRLRIRNNSCIITHDNHIYLIDKVIYLRCQTTNEDKVVALAMEVELSDRSSSRDVLSRFIYFGQQLNDISILEISRIQKKCVYIPTQNDRVMVIPIVNTMETD